MSGYLHLNKVDTIARDKGDSLFGGHMVNVSIKLPIHDVVIVLSKLVGPHDRHTHFSILKDYGLCQPVHCLVFDFTFSSVWDLTSPSVEIFDTPPLAG